MVRPSNYNADIAGYSSTRLRRRPPATRAITSRYSGFKLPRGWAVEEVPRPDASRVDKQQSPKNRKLIICGGKMMKFNEQTINGNQLAIVASGKSAANSPYKLPDGWVIEEVPRRNMSYADKYYYEPGSGRKFRSFISVQRYVEELREDVPLSTALAEIREMNRPLSKAFKLGHLVKKNSISCKKQCMRNNTQTSSFVNPPMKVNWVLASPKGDVWNPFIFDAEIPDSVKQQWNERFMLVMNVDDSETTNCNMPSSCTYLNKTIVNFGFPSECIKLKDALLLSVIIFRLS
ncbi:hypothetical protein ACH5RR_010023 [Cinchona calisaya]|uniref:MBD domain-containing protein n=1 Tax=Cinchona calisaya TaxID=153742 RepID=A0ABD3AFU4_9GENT